MVSLVRVGWVGVQNVSDERTIVVTRNFGEDLAFSDKMSDEPAWAQYYVRLFPDLVGTMKVRVDSPLQRHGVDRLLVFASGLQLTVDEKIRRKYYGDILLELWSNLERRTPGWTIDPTKVCDYIAYAIPNKGICFFLPYPILREAFRLHWKAWSEAYAQGRGKGKPFLDSPNPRYKTRNVAVTWPVLKAALTAQMHRKYSGDLELPVLKEVVSESHPAQLTLEFMATPNP